MDNLNAQQKKRQPMLTILLINFFTCVKNHNL